MKASSNKSLDFEINLLPVISVLAVCISFLLLTTVWVQIGTFDLSQALGTEGAADAQAKKPTLWLTLSNNGDVQVVVKNAPALNDRLQLNQVRGTQSRVSVSNIADLIEKIKAKVPELNTGLVIPAAQSSYEDLVKVMDQMKKNNIAEVGIAPL